MCNACKPAVIDAARQPVSAVVVAIAVPFSKTTSAVGAAIIAPKAKSDLAAVVALLKSLKWENEQ